LRYFRDRDGREVDFVVTEDRRPILLVEAKLSDTDVDQSLRYLLARCPGATAWQVSATGKKNYRTPEGVRVAPVMELLKTLI
jgi:predicted AAA+ superfamily ATPase